MDIKPVKVLWIGDIQRFGMENLASLKNLDDAPSSRDVGIQLKLSVPVNDGFDSIP